MVGDPPVPRTKVVVVVVVVVVVSYFVPTTLARCWLLHVVGVSKAPWTDPRGGKPCSTPTSPRRDARGRTVSPPCRPVVVDGFFLIGITKPPKDGLMDWCRACCLSVPCGSSSVSPFLRVCPSCVLIVSPCCVMDRSPHVNCPPPLQGGWRGREVLGRREAVEGERAVFVAPPPMVGGYCNSAQIDQSNQWSRSVEQDERPKFGIPRRRKNSVCRHC
jgi:hypothetical protein